MTKEEYLAQYRWLREKLKGEKWMRESMFPGTAEAGQQPGDLGPETSQMAEQLKAKMDAKIRLCYDQLAHLKAEIDDILDSLEPREKELIMFRYLLGWKWNDIAERIHVSRASVFRMHKEILSRLTLPEHPTDAREILAQNGEKRE